MMNRGVYNDMLESIMQTFGKTYIVLALALECEQKNPSNDSQISTLSNIEKCCEKIFGMGGLERYY